MCADHKEFGKIGTSRYSSKLKQDNRRRIGKNVVVAGLRTLENQAECFAVVTKMLGNSMCEVRCSDNVERLCMIRKKFSGRQKQRNQVAIGVTIMVGLRDWEKNEKSRLQKCDLLEVYTESELRKLKQRGAINLENITHNSIVTEDDEIEFDTSDRTNDKLQQQLANLDIDVGQQPNRNYDDTFSSDEDVNIDDI
jgi:initiation factor 1A